MSRDYNNQRNKKEEQEPVQQTVNQMADKTNWLKFEIEYANHELLDYEKRNKRRAAIVTLRKIEKLRDELQSRTGNRNNTILPSDCPVNISALFSGGADKRTFSLKLDKEGLAENSLSNDDWTLYSELINKRIVMSFTDTKHKNYQKIKERLDFLESHFSEEVETETKENVRTPYKEEVPF